MHPIYTRYPMMLPFVGSAYTPGSTKAILLIGESHYLPSDSTQHRTAERWYRSDASMLNPTEVAWINPSEIIKHSIATGFRIRAHSIFRNAFRVIHQNGPIELPHFGSVGHHVVFYNYFLRPARTGMSIHIEDQDNQVAEEVFQSVYAMYQPAMVVFLSRLAFKSWHPRLHHLVSVPTVSTPHPGCIHWNRVSPSYGGRRGRDVLGDFIKTNWPQSSEGSSASDLNDLTAPIEA